VFRFTFSTAGLFVLNVLYVMAGGYIFEYLEKYNEEVGCFTGLENYKRAENSTLTLLLNIATKVKCRIAINKISGWWDNSGETNWLRSISK